MYYPIKLKPVYKDYIWGGRYFEKLDRELPDGTVAESWELSCHKNGISVIANGEHAGKTLPDIIKTDSINVLGRSFPVDCSEIPLLIKLIDANDKLSVQVHCEDNYAAVYEGGLGKNEMWYIMDVRPEAKLVAGLKPGVTREEFDRAIRENRIEDCLQDIEVKPGDVINIPAGLVHAIGAGIVIAEIQQCSDTTYRVFDYNRVDKKGVSRPLQLEKALEVIKFEAGTKNIKCEGMEIKVNESCNKTIFLANKFFACERYEVNGSFSERCDGSKFFVYICIEGRGNIEAGAMAAVFKAGETMFLPAALGEYRMSGEFKALKTYVPDFINDIVEPMRKAGCADADIYRILNN
ncbi:mannose-6-phosphate isomerase type 1 [Ruminiclostridium sufflavum DSM 19573]|uniref:Phosphohexomutase n=1 Tax=Ruminiclostridium sufflavum DSM 19573 TaxID=1121337 RepID=A0A318XM92_9FIRM|nr:type I phosphomannose isomerase catalytic subunit [Ruminiclostridium sufflavum]PYG87822.1 mannose-6-phosphate isomerase type 1 [Ruminiclostridium sufflavum DSM 19573]